MCAMCNVHIKMINDINQESHKPKINKAINSKGLLIPANKKKKMNPGIYFERDPLQIF